MKPEEISPLTVGFVGLGDQGEPMASRILHAGFPLLVYARRPVQAQPLVEQGATASPTLAALAEQVDLLGICVGTEAQVEEVCRTALPHLKAGAIVALHSTVAPRTGVGISDAAAGRGVHVLDAPVSGGRVKAFDGELTVMVGGEASIVARARPVFETFGRLVLHVGPVGSGELLKLVNNYLFAAQISVAHDAVRLLESLDMDVPQSMTAIASSTGSSRCIQMFVDAAADHVFPRHQDGRARGAELLGKDIGLIDSALEDRGLSFPEPLDHTVREGLRIARESGAPRRQRLPSPPRDRRGPT